MNQQKFLSCLPVKAFVECSTVKVFALEVCAPLLKHNMITPSSIGRLHDGMGESESSNINEDNVSLMQIHPVFTGRNVASALDPLCIQTWHCSTV